jgi:hypothetical protein
MAEASRGEGGADIPSRICAFSSNATRFIVSSTQLRVSTTPEREPHLTSLD